MNEDRAHRHIKKLTQEREEALPGLLQEAQGQWDANPSPENAAALLLLYCEKRTECYEIPLGKPGEGIPNDA